jgi:hypothetical protein
MKWDQLVDRVASHSGAVPDVKSGKTARLSKRSPKLQLSKSPYPGLKPGGSSIKNQPPLFQRFKKRTIIPEQIKCSTKIVLSNFRTK